MPRGIIHHLREKFRHRHVLQSLFKVLGRHHIEIVPYYVTHESLKHAAEPRVDTELGPIAACLLSPAEIEEVYAHPDSEVMAYEKATLLDERCLCFGLKLKGEMAAYMWCNLHQCHSRLTKFPIKENEAYLCSAVTLKAYRGRNLAPLLRYELYRYLDQIGRTNFYSITEFFNTPARKFKEKLGARPLRLRLHIRLGSRCQWNITLKRFRI
jgi:GNAT superfamily N-acetyltransferase